MNEVERSNDGVVLRKCAFCGGEAEVHSRCNYVETGNEVMYFVKCCDCKVESIWRYKKERAIEAWNTRAPVDKVIERLEGDMKERISTAYVTSDVFVDGKANGLEWAIEIIKEELM